MSGERHDERPQFALDPELDEVGNHVLRGTALNGEPLTVRIPCDTACRVCEALRNGTTDA